MENNPKSVLLRLVFYTTCGIFYLNVFRNAAKNEIFEGFSGNFGNKFRLLNLINLVLKTNNFFLSNFHIFLFFLFERPVL